MNAPKIIVRTDGNVRIHRIVREAPVEHEGAQEVQPQDETPAVQVSIDTPIPAQVPRVVVDEFDQAVPLVAEPQDDGTFAVVHDQPVEHEKTQPAKPKRTIKQIKEAIARLEQVYHNKRRPLEAELEEARAYRQATCPHPEDRIQIRDQNYMEAGRMSGPVEWKEKVCRRCGKVIAVSQQKVTESWEPTK